MKRAKGDGQKNRAEPVSTPLYIAMHDTKLAQCLASGFLSPSPRGGEVLDHHSRAGRLVLEKSTVSQQALAGARAGLDYGRVAVVEVAPGAPFESTLANGLVLALPLSSVVRVYFDSAEAIEEFEARVSGFDDIELGIVRLEVDSALFPEETSKEAQSDWVATEAVVTDETELDDSPAPNDSSTRIQWLDRTSGSLAATFAALSSSQEAELIKELANLPGLCGPIGEGPSVPSAVAAVLDRDKESGATAPVLLAFERAIGERSPGESLDPGEIVEQVKHDFEQQGTEVTPIVSRFLDTTREFIAARREMPPRAFSDEGGSITLRALMLFLVQPDPDRVSAVRHQAENLGSRVFSLYSSLVGFCSGFSGLPIGIKGGVDRTLAVPELALGILAREPLMVDMRVSWDALDGTKSVDLEWRDKELCRVHVAVNELLKSCAGVARSCGYRADFNSDNGKLSIHGDIDGVSRVTEVVLRESLPVFPRSQGLELKMQVGMRIAKKALREQLEMVNESALDSGVFGTGIPVGRGNAIVLHVFVSPPPSADALKTAFQSLVALAAKLEKESPPRTRKIKQESRGDAN